MTIKTIDPETPYDLLATPSMMERCIGMEIYASNEKYLYTMAMRSPAIQVGTVKRGPKTAIVIFEGFGYTAKAEKQIEKLLKQLLDIAIIYNEEEFGATSSASIER